MARPAAIWSACVMLSLAGGVACLTAAQSRDIISQDLKQLRAPGKVEAAIWTRRPEGYTLQVVLKLTSPAPLRLVDGRRSVPGAESGSPRLPAPAMPQLQVWVLRADGTIIQPRNTRPANAATAPPRSLVVDATYVFPDVAAEQAVAVAMRVDGDFYIEKLESLGS